MSLNLRIFLAYFLIVGVAAYLILNVFMSELKPGMRQSTEDTLVDMSNLLAEVVAEEFKENPNNLSHFTIEMDKFLHRLHKAKISSVTKKASNVRVYITDSDGIVRYDSANKDVGKDYSRWNDVYKTLRGHYGARSTKSDPDNELSTVMYVAAPIMHNNNVIGVLTVAKANISVQPFIDMAKSNIESRGLWLLIFSLVAALSLSFWLTRSIRKLVNYASNVSLGRQVEIPHLAETELAKLATAMDNMRRELEGKDYVEKYVYALTHELKSPVSAIKGASEILTPAMPAIDQKRFIDNIQHEVDRIDDMINRLLSLVTVENQTQLENIEHFDFIPIINQVIKTKQVQVSKHSLAIKTSMPAILYVSGDQFLLAQAIDNLLQNAIDFSPESGVINIEVTDVPQTMFIIKDQGSGIPTFALEKVFDRFYSLARPASQKKSTGLGLCFVKQIAELHHGSVSIKNNNNGGAIARLTLGVNI